MIDLHALSHFLQILIFPPGLIILLLIFGLIISLRHSMKGKVVLIFATGLLWFFSSPYVAQSMIDELQTQYPPLNIKNIKLSTDSALVVLGAGVENSFKNLGQSNVSERTLVRLHYAVFLHQQLHLPIIVSGGNRSPTAFTEAKEMRITLNDYYHVPVLAEENLSRNTEDESVYVLPILQQYHIKKIYLITDAFHMVRSYYIFRKYFPEDIDIIPAPIGLTSFQAEGFVNYLPLLNALNMSVFALHEYIGLGWYWVKNSSSPI